MIIFIYTQISTSVTPDLVRIAEDVLIRREAIIVHVGLAF